MPTSFPTATRLSTMLALAATLGACGLHLGSPPTARWSLDHVVSPVAEPVVNDALLRALRHAGVRHRGGAPITVRVAQADWRPSGAFDGGVAWKATLAVEVVAAGQTTRLQASRLVAPAASSGDAADARAAAFASLAATLAADVAAWLDTVSALP